MKYTFTITEVRDYIQVNLSTGESKIVHVSNRNNLSVEKHLELLNLNDDNNMYFELLV